MFGDYHGKVPSCLCVGIVCNYMYEHVCVYVNVILFVVLPTKMMCTCTREGLFQIYFPVFLFC